MENRPKKRFFAKHAKSSAMVVSLAIHALLIVVALSFVAVTVIQKADQGFEAKPVNRPKMAMKKLQVPVKMKPKKPKPKLRKQIMVKTRMDRKMPDIKMPEVAGVKGGMGAIGDGGLGTATGLGFTMPEIEIFGVKSRGEKIFILLDASPEIMRDEMGGIPAYALIKGELVKILEGLSPTTLFNIAVYDRGQTFVLFPDMVAANKANVEKVNQWLAPLNKILPKMGTSQYGPSTLGPGGRLVSEEFLEGKLQTSREWYKGSALAMKEQADAVYLLGSIWGTQWHTLEERPNWSEAAQKKWDECFQQGLKLLEQESKERIAKGQPPRVIRKAPHEINKVYFPDIEFPPEPERYFYTPKDYREAFIATALKYARTTTQTRSGLAKKPKAPEFSFNVIHFMPRDAGDYQAQYDNSVDQFKTLASISRGQYRSIQGLEEIKSTISGKTTK